MTRRGALALPLAVAGCGFRLRTWDLATAFASARIIADASVDLDRDLGLALAEAGVSLVESAADVVVTLSAQRSDRRHVSVTATGRAAEVELTLEVAFVAHGGDGRALAAQRVLRSERLARVDADNLLGSSAEQDMLMGEMRADLVGRLMRALDVLSRPSPVARHAG